MNKIEQLEKEMLTIVTEMAKDFIKETIPISYLDTHVRYDEYLKLLKKKRLLEIDNKT